MTMDQEKNKILNREAVLSKDSIFNNLMRGYHSVQVWRYSKP